MKTDRIRRLVVAGLGATALVLAGCAEMKETMHSGHMVNVTLTGGEEVPPVATAARGAGSIQVHMDKSVSGSVTTTGIAGVAAHIHLGARGANGPVAVGLVKTSENVWSVPAGAKFTDPQYESFKAGNLYVNVHSAANKGGEIRGQMNP